MIYPVISISIATLNAGKTLEKTLESIRKQSYPQDKIEILVIDGGSTDNTLALAKKYNCTVIPNPQVDIIYARHLGFIKAKGRYLMYLDADEILENPKSLMIKYLTFQKNIHVKGIMPSGYKTPQDYSPINYYVNEFGDPFSFFCYRESKGYKKLIPDWQKKYPVVHNDKECIILNLSKTKPLPLIELSAGGCIIDLAYMKKAFPEIKKHYADVGHLFYFFNSQGQLLALTKHDPTIHYSSASIKKYLKKIASRIKNNVFLNDMGKAGFEGREIFQSNLFQLRKYLFIPYSFSLIFPFFDGIFLALSRKKSIYLLHPFLCLYTSCLILYYVSLKTLGIKIKANSYGN